MDYPYYSPYKSVVGSPFRSTRYGGSGYLARSFGYRSRSPQATRGHGYSEFIPIERSYIDYVPEHKLDYRPVERRYTDYQEIRHEVDYVPVPRVQYDYYPQERSYYVGETNNLPLAGSRTGYGSWKGQYPAGYGSYRSGYYGQSYTDPYRY